jgi:hypothetical protein
MMMTNNSISSAAVSAEQKATNMQNLLTMITRSPLARVVMNYRPDQSPRWPSIHIDDGCGRIGAIHWVNSDPSENAWGICWSSKITYRAISPSEL